MRKALLLLALAATAQADPIVIKAARVIDGRGRLYRNAAVVVDGAKIVRIDEHPQRADRDLGDRTLMPGGIDTHVHIGWHFNKNGRSSEGENETPQEAVLFAAENGWRTLMGGVTTVQSLGAAVDKPLRDAIARGVLPGPRILTAIDPIVDEKLSPDELRAAVR